MIGSALILLVAAHFLTPSGHHGKAYFTKHLLEHLDSAISEYEADTGILPPSLDDLINPGYAENWQGPHVKSGALVDPWDNPLLYARVNDQRIYFLFSTGKNGKLYGHGEESVLFSPNSGPAPNNGFNRTPESSGPAKPGESSGGAG